MTAAAQAGETDPSAGSPSIALSWSGGKDSALALWALRQAGTPPALLLSTVDAAAGIVPHHGVSVELLRRQAAAVGLPLTTVDVHAGASNAAYEQGLRAAFAAPPLQDVGEVAFGDLFLADLRAYREQRLGEVGRGARFPLWGADTAALAREFVAVGFRAVLVAVDGDQLPHEFLGRPFDAALLAELPPGVDPCGENGEFHTFVHDGPVFERALAVRAGERHGDGRFAWLELVEEAPAS